MSRVAPIEVFQDEDALGPKTYPQEPFPREYARLSVPIGPREIGTLYIPGRMTPDEWDVMMRFLVVARAGIVSEQ